MALATQCPHCSTTFRVASDQLKLRGGIVRCGACHEIFDGNTALIDLAALAGRQGPRAQAPATPAAAAPEAAPAPGAQAAPPEPSASDAFDAAVAAIDARQDAPEEEPIYTLDFDTTFDPFGILPKAALPEPAQASPRQPEAVPESQVTTGNGAGLEPAPAGGAQHLTPAEPEAESEPGPLATESGGDLAATVPEPEQEPEPVDPEGRELLPGAAADAAPPDANPVAEPATTPVAQPAPDTAHAATRMAQADEVPQDRSLDPLFDLPADEELVAASLPEDDPHEPDSVSAPATEAHAHLPLRQSAGAGYTPAAALEQPQVARSNAAERKAARRAKAAASTRPHMPEADEPEFVRQSREQEHAGKKHRILMMAGSLLLLLVLATQLMTTFRNVLAARFPATKPVLAATCALFGCRVELPAQIETLVIETGELQTVSAGMLSLTTLLRNQGALVQAWPNIELTLTDTNDKPLLRRVFTPAEYLPKGTAAASGFAPRAEQPVKLHFTLDQLKPSGYHIAVFYP
jgi:predicted Zn finger-like uncharacterized protein